MQGGLARKRMPRSLDELTQVSPSSPNSSTGRSSTMTSARKRSFAPNVGINRLLPISSARPCLRARTGARTNTADAEAPSLRLYRGLEAVARARAVYKSDQRGMAELAEYDEVEPDMEHDPTLASCCRREIKDRRIKQSKLDHIRSGMPATVRPCTALGYCPRARSSSRRILSSVQCMPRLSSSTYLSQLVDKSLITSICAKGAESPPLTASTPRRTCCAPGLLGACSITRGGRKMLSAYTPSTTWPSALRRKLHCRQTCRAWRHDRGRDRCSSQRRAGSRVSATSPHAPPAAPVPHSALSALPFLL